MPKREPSPPVLDALERVFAACDAEQEAHDALARAFALSYERVTSRCVLDHILGLAVVHFRCPELARYICAMIRAGEASRQGSAPDAATTHEEQP